MSPVARVRQAVAAPRVSSADIVARITDAILQHRLAPGTKLTEETLADFFGVSRTKVRQALFQLATNRLVTLERGRGAFVSRPSVRESRELFAARRVIESALIEHFVAVASPQDMAFLRRHIVSEERAIRSCNVDRATRLLGDFHLAIARRAGNQVLAEILHDLVSRTSLVILLYCRHDGMSCSIDDHKALLEALSRRNAKAAVSLMTDHLSRVEAELALRDQVVETPDIRAALAGVRGDIP
jgi:DNA-binding GntR family transcriptional regulator